MKRLNTLEFVLLLIIAVLSISIFVVGNTSAEQSGGTPDSGENSILKQVYIDLQGLGYGSEEGSYGSMWNRIISSANWVPEGSATEAQVVSGYTFYKGSRTLKTGTLDHPNYEAQSLQVLDFRDSNGSASFAGWQKTNSNPEVWKDKRTGLYWSAVQGSATDNQFTVSSCPFFTTVPRGNYDGSEPTCGNAINRCATLVLDANGDGTNETNWYLPTQAELMQAYLDGIYLSTNTNWVTGNLFWSSTQDQSDTTYAWYTHLYSGYTDYYYKTHSYYIRCVCRD